MPEHKNDSADSLSRWPESEINGEYGPKEKSQPCAADGNVEIFLR